MNRIGFRVLLMLAGIVAVPAGVAAWRPFRVVLPPAGSSGNRSVDVGRDTLAPGSLTRGIVAHDPFRPERRPASVAFLVADPGSTAPPAPPRPVLVLTGIVWGPVPQAVLEGIPGTEGPRVVRSGDVLGELRIRRITTEVVTVTGMDTTWVLKVRKPW